MPADKSSYGNFEALAQQNQQVIRRILESSDKIALESKDPYDEEVLKKIRDMYSSCLNESLLDGIGGAPLEHFVKTIRKLFRGEGTEIGRRGKKRKSKGLTAALAFLHSQGMMYSLREEHYTSSSFPGISSLFSFGIEGDVGDDPNHMVLWFSQPDLGLPSKVCPCHIMV